MQFSLAVHGHSAKSLVRLADEFCDGRIILMGGGGYNRTNLALGWNEVLKALLINFWRAFLWKMIVQFVPR